MERRPIYVRDVLQRRSDRRTIATLVDQWFRAHPEQKAITPMDTVINIKNILYHWFEVQCSHGKDPQKLLHPDKISREIRVHLVIDRSRG